MCRLQHVQAVLFSSNCFVGVQLNTCLYRKCDTVLWYLCAFILTFCGLQTCVISLMINWSKSFSSQYWILYNCQLSTALSEDCSCNYTSWSTWNYLNYLTLSKVMSMYLWTCCLQYLSDQHSSINVLTFILLCWSDNYWAQCRNISLPKLYDLRHYVGAILSVMTVLIKWEYMEYQREEHTVCKAAMEGISPR